MSELTTPLLAPQQLDELVTSARRAHPAESCAIGLGAQPGTVAELVHVANVAHDPAREFEVDPVALADLLVDARERGLEPTLVAHSHPGGDPTPSPRDAALALDWPGVARAIVTVDGQVQVHV